MNPTQVFQYLTPYWSNINSLIVICISVYAVQYGNVRGTQGPVAQEPSQSCDIHEDRTGILGQFSRWQRSHWRHD